MNVSDILLLDPDVLMAERGEGIIGRKVLVFRETASTNDLLLQMGAGREAEGTLVFALSQSKGKGQHGHKWDSAPTLGLWFSFLLRPVMHADLSAHLTAFAALAVQEACGPQYALDARIKAPNDIYIGGRKVAGILSETRIGKSNFAVIGIGINVRHKREDFPAELQEKASSLQCETGREMDLQDAAIAVLKSLNLQYSRFMKNPVGLHRDYLRETGKFSH
ncbi:MAG: biotin--[acetyl-CoA-carboxylase] ligase [Chthoniobacterales bacterium]